jgi:hypothetical protein
MANQDYDNRIYTEVINNGYSTDLANLLVSQANYETGGYSNNAFILGNNAYGYKYVKGSKFQLSDEGNISSEGNAYAKYATIEDSVDEVLAWLERRQKEGKFVIADLHTADDYAAALKSGDYYGQTSTEYATGLDYYLKVTQGSILNFVHENTNLLLTGGIGLVLISASAYLFYKFKKKI